MKKSKSLKSIIIKSKIKNIFFDLLFLSIVAVTAFICNKFVEMFIYVFSYTFIRLEFTKAVHGSDFTERPSKAIWICRLITTAVQLISIIVVVKLDISKYANILLALCLGIINFFAKDYLEYRVKKYIEKKTFYKGMKKEEIPEELTGIEYDIIYQYYIERYQLNKIAMKIGYSIDNVKKIKAKILKRYSD